jgi:hypothetical protein
MRDLLTKRFIEGADRNHPTLLPECLDDYVDDNNPVCGIYTFMGMLELTYQGHGKPTNNGA